MEWQPIETAPRDGIAVIVYSKEWIGNPSICVYEPDFGQWAIDGDGAFVVPEPTHWMPIPEPPK